MANIGTLTAHIGVDNMGLNRGLAQAQGRFSQFSSGAMKSIAKIGGAFAALGLAVGGLAVFRSITKTGIDFEQTMTTVAGVMRATADESKRLAAAARKMGETTEWSASEAGGALQFLGMAGFEANKAIAALPGTLDLATAGQIGLGRAADIATNALTAMGLNVEELERVNDVFVGTITRSNTNMEMMAESFKYAAPVARAYGYTVEELSGLIGMLGNAGIQGSMAGTQLAMALQKTNKVAKDFGVPGGKFVDVLEQLREKGYSATEVMTAFGLRAGRAAGVLYEATDATREFQETLGGVQGEAKRLADAMRSTVGASFKELKSVVESLALDVFETYRDELKGFVVDTTTWIRENKDSIVGFVNEVTKVFSGIIKVINKLGKAIGQATQGFSDFAESMKTDTEEAATSLADFVTKMQVGLVPPDFSIWQKFWALMTNLWIDIGQVMFMVLRQIEATVAAVVEEIIITIGAVWKAMSLDFQGALEEIKKTGDVAVGTWESWLDAWNDMAANMRTLDPGKALHNYWIENNELLKEYQALLDQINKATGPQPLPTVGSAGGIGGAGGTMLTMPSMPAMPTEGLAEFIARVQDMVAEYKAIQQNRYDWLYAHEKISSDEYLAFLERKLAGEEEFGGKFSDTWIAIYQQMEGVKSGVAAADRARWAEQVAAQEEFLDLMFVGYDTFWRSILDLGMTGSERWKAIFESMAQSFIASEAAMLKAHVKNWLLQKTVVEGVEKSKLAAVAAGTAGRIAFYIKEGAAAIASAAKSIYSAAAKIFEAHSWIPFVGVAIAGAFIGAMLAQMGAFKKFHEGGLASDEMLAIFKKKEYVVREPAVRAVGVPALEYINRTGRLPGGGEGAIQLTIGDVTIGGTGTPRDFFLLEDFKDAVVEIVKEKLRNRELEL